MQTKDELKTEIGEINKKIISHGEEIKKLQEAGLRILGKIELMEEQEKSDKK